MMMTVTVNNIHKGEFSKLGVVSFKVSMANIILNLECNNTP